MRKYRNVSGVILHIDCMTYTKHLQPGEVAALPVSRDVRHLLRSNQLVIVKERKTQNPIKQRKRGRPKRKKKFNRKEKPLKEEIIKEPLQDTETE